MFILETALGQYTRQGGIRCWGKICPLFEGKTSGTQTRGGVKHNLQFWWFMFFPGLGFAGQIIVFYGSISYIVVLAWAFFYFFSSFSGELPWTTCGNAWNTGELIIRRHLFDADRINTMPCKRVNNQYLTCSGPFSVISVRTIQRKISHVFNLNIKRKYLLFLNSYHNFCMLFY